MAYRVRCSACGKSLRLPDGDAGLAVVCLACGAKFVAPPAGAADDEVVGFAISPGVAAAAAAGDAAGTAVAHSDSSTGSGFALAPAHRAEAHVVARPIAVDKLFGQAPVYDGRVEAIAPAGPLAPARQRGAIALSVGVVALLLAGLLAFITSRGGREGRQYAAELTGMREEARALRARGELQAAHQKYRELDGRANELGAAGNPDLAAVVEEARSEQQAVYAEILRQSGAGGGGPATTGGDAAGSPSTSSVAPDVAVTDGSPPPTPPGVDSLEPPGGSGPAPPPGAGSPSASGETVKEPDGGAAAGAVARPPLAPMPEPVTGVTDEQIGRSIQLGVDYVFAKFDPAKRQLVVDAAGNIGVDGGGGVPAVGRAGAGDSGYECGLNALAVYALLQCSQSISDQRLHIRGEFMPRFIDGMKAIPPSDGRVTYARAIRATALAMYNRPQDRAALRADVDYLLKTHRNGAYHYQGIPERRGAETPGYLNVWDNSNSQYGLLGVWAGAEVGIEVPGDYWRAVERHWVRHQGADGTWGYSGPGGGGTISMTAAGTASLLVTHDYRYQARYGIRVGRDPYSPELARALRWWGEGNRASSVQSGWWGYTLYGIERVGLASGFKHLGPHDWYRELAGEVVSRQGGDGSWGADLVDTCYALLFLARGRHPILMNKLRFERAGELGAEKGYWANRPRDAANLARYTGRRLERPLNWQVVGIDRPWQDWLDSPILSIASHTAPFFTDADADKLRSYVEAGGMLYLQADGEERATFDAFAQRLARRLFPQYPMADLPRGHPLYRVNYTVEAPPPLKAVTNGARILMLYSPNDIARSWQTRDESMRESYFQLGVNLFLYAAGKQLDLRNRLETPYVSPPETAPPNGYVRVARVRYAGNWDPEPGAWRRFVNWFARQTGTGLLVDTVTPAELTPARNPVAHLTGTAPFEPSEQEVAALRAYVEGGGVLLIDSCGGSAEFADSMKALLGRAFPDTSHRAVAGRHPLLSAGPPGMEDLRRPRFRPFAVEQLGGTAGAPRLVAAGKGHVVFCPVDLTSGLLGTRTWAIFGYDPAYAQSLLKNVVFWTLDGQRTN